ncbi:MAG: hypothetical protein HY790_07330 [Deltaproteobacteria bacterium]|nr:hypothetical protein [Deltaproteobacteria bacterium]MBI4795636.1 hypothetical protein [Deltaproteobacteria bacterium]
MMTIAHPIFVFRATPWNIVVSGLLAIFAQGSQAIYHRKVITMNSDAELVIFVSGHQNDLQSEG